MSLILNSVKIPTPGIETVSWLDDPAVPQATDKHQRTQWIRAVVLHTVHGKSGRLLPGIKSSTRAEVYAKYQANTTRNVSWDYTIDTDGTVVVSNDPIRFYTWHTDDIVNPISIGIEMIQDDNGDLYEGQMEAVVKFLDFLTKALADLNHPIQRQVPVTADGKPVRGVIPRIASDSDVKKVVGIYGHRNRTSNKGPGDPGDYIFDYLLRAGYLGCNLDGGADVIFWRDLQVKLGIPADGIPGRATQQAILAQKHGLWVVRPGD